MNVSDHEGVQALLDDLALPLPGGFVPHYNVAPTMAVPTVFAEEEGALA
ncbi:MAG: SOS response-associated peptidase, partial [Actinobacteria bacterium]|nr:SOS response-associated peptidase [Actinomycetota bacterium]